MLQFYNNLWICTKAPKIHPDPYLHSLFFSEGNIIHMTECFVILPKRRHFSKWEETFKHQRTQKLYCCDSNQHYSEVPNKSVIFLTLFWDFFSTYIALLGPTRLSIFGKSLTYYTVFYIINIKKFPPTLGWAQWNLSSLEFKFDDAILSS